MSGCAKGPWRDAVRMRLTSVPSSGKRWSPRAEPMVKFSPGCAILDRREHGAAEQHEAVRVLMVRSDGLAHEIGDVAADLRHRAGAGQLEAVLALDPQRDGGAPQLVEGEGVIEQANERPDRAGRVVVLALAQSNALRPQSRNYVIAQGRADDRRAR
jgi:hypothetical protein